MNRMLRRALAGMFLLVLLSFGASRAKPAGSEARMPPAEAAALFNAGTLALDRGEVGPAVAFLTAALRIEPRAPDVRVNLSRALRAAARLRGDEDSTPDRSAPPLLSAVEAWWLAAILTLLGSALGIASILRGGSAGARRAHGTGLLLLGIGTSLATVLYAAAREERAHPEAVVIVPTLSIERAPDEPSRAAVILSAGERVRIGRARGALVEVRLGGTSIGWGERSGLWRVAETPRYTPHHESP